MEGKPWKHSQIMMTEGDVQGALAHIKYLKAEIEDCEKGIDTQIKRMYDAQVGVTRIAEMLNMTRQTVYNRMNRANMYE